MDLGLKDKVVLITGAGSQIGFGKTTAVTLAKEGCDVVVCDIDIEGAEQTAAEIRGLGRKAIAIKVDVTVGAEVNEMVKKALEQFGKIDILVNNAGAVSPLKPFLEKTEADWDFDINLNLKGMLFCTKAVLDHMISRRSGKIINISSIGAVKGVPFTAVYCAAKAGVVNFTQSMAGWLAPLGIIVNSVGPGLGLTHFGGGERPPGLMENIKKLIPIQRATDPQDIANVVTFLASSVSDDIVGQNIRVDGGESMG